MNARVLALLAVATAAALPISAAAQAAARQGAQPVKPLPDAAPSNTDVKSKTTSLPAHGLFEGDKLSASARQRLTEIVIDAIGLQVEVALVVPTGPWNVTGGGSDERDLTPARLAAVKRFLTERGVDANKIYVESRIDEKIKEPRLDIQIAGRPAEN
jgi:OOP family OmpA-OmpF porin